MRRQVLVTAFVATACPFIFAAGCGDSHPPVDSSLTEATVKGIVKIAGKVADGGGEISFNPSNVERKVGPRTAKIAEDGLYSITTYTGGNTIRFFGPFLKDHQEIATSRRFCELPAGESVLDFDLLGEGDKPRGGLFPVKPVKKFAKKKATR